MTHDYHSLVAHLANSDSPPELCYQLVSPEEYQMVVDTILFKTYDFDYTDDAEYLLLNTLPELIEQNHVSLWYMPVKLLEYLKKYPQYIDRFYTILRGYLALKIDNLEPLSEIEQFIAKYIHELDEQQIITVEIDEELLHLAAKHPENLTNEQKHSLNIYLNAKIIDRQVLSNDELKIMRYLSSTDNVDSSPYSEFATQADKSNDILSVEWAKLEYGYDIYDFSDLIERLESAEYQKNIYTINEANALEHLKRPFSMREIRVIKQAWNFDPSNETERWQVLSAYMAEQDVLDPQGAHDKYVARKQRYRERV